MSSHIFREMTTVWRQIDVQGICEVSGLPGVRVESLPVFLDERGSLFELYRNDEVPSEFKPVMACCSWSAPGVTRGPHEHVMQDDYFIFAGPSDFSVYLWDNRPGSPLGMQGWMIHTGARAPTRVYVPRGVVHAYRNTGNVHGLVITVTSLLFKGEGRRDPVDEIRHELNPQSPYRPPQP
ncbi:MAG: dTDP-4-dehydrorhamnose 3,5-epimerase family protein [Verrucomicrobiota bacterium]